MTYAMSDYNVKAMKELIAALMEWRASLEGDGWSEQDIKDCGRPGMGRIFTALDALTAGQRPTDPHSPDSQRGGT